MPKNDIDYSNTIIYKIFCKDSNITDIYVGHTTNFIKRKYGHKISCDNTNNKLKIYEIIRNNGGWENWDMVEIAKYNCKDSTEARIKEQEHYKELKANMNSISPYGGTENFNCLICNLHHFSSIQNYAEHIVSKKHLEKVNHKKNSDEEIGNSEMYSENSENDKQVFVCNLCDYKCFMKQHIKQHILSKRHKTNEGNLGNINGNDTINFLCKCGKKFKTNSGLWKHNQKCYLENEKNNKEIEISKQDNNPTLSDKELILTLLKQNAELLEIVKNGTHITSNTNCNNNNNSNNKTFNLQVFLNETCKDAMNIMEFVDSIKLQLSDLESVGELGYVKGLSNIIVKNLRALDVTKRPVHCSDVKREILYVKDNDVWEKEDPENTKMKKAVKYIAYKNTKLLPLWKQTYPECMQYDSSKNDKYNYMVIEAMGGMGDNEADKINKIIKQIAKEVVIDK